MKTEIIKTEAVSSGKLEVSWHRINWYKAHQHVRRMQLRIAKATREGKTRKIKFRQRLLTYSFLAKALVVRIVTENHGKTTPDVDSQTWLTPNAKFQAVSSLKKRVTNLSR
jgi:RNA-directed DNA polymerase